ncbi:MAG: protein kinase, partial [Myxococcales bacterium]|nr:protein kinase [Myxococcales bacterium]
MTGDPTAGEQTAGAAPERTPTSPAIRGVIERGGRIGRYLVLRVQGAGAMGLVYLAYDPELDRKLAVKVLQAEAAPDLGLQKETLIREARALARVSHPNVITVHDVGVHEGQVFIAMELVPGVELGQWLAGRAQADPRAPWRRWAELRGPLLAAGRGLAAAHAAGLVHRDFKPANVIVGPAGVRVLDFGLARAYAESEVRPREVDVNAGGPGLTATVAVVGTPAYMAPEVHDAAPVDVRADQYAFCVTLYEALLGRRPFMGRTGAALVLAKHEPGPWLAEARVLPAFLRQVLTRGLDPDPARRFADMDTLLAALAYDPSARRWWIAGATLAIAAAAWMVAGPREAPRCASGERRVAAVWHPARADGLRAALRASGQGSRVVASIDEHVAAWRESYAAACTATFVEREQSQALFDRRQTCLNDRLAELDALLRVLERGGAATGENAVAAVGQLTPLTRCRDEALLAAVEPPPPDLAAEALRVREQLRTAEALERAGQYAQGLPLAEFAASEARRLAYAPVRAEALLRLGMLRQWSGDYAGAEAALSDAMVLATARKYEDIAARAALELVFLVGYQLARYGEARVWWRVASAAAERTGHAEEYLPQLWNHWGAAQEVHGEHAAAREAYSEALAGWEARLGPDHPEATPTLNNLALI